MLDEWIRKYFRPQSWDIWENCVAHLKEIRKLRSKPAHSISNNVFDQKYVKQQRDLIKNAYDCVRTIRQIFYNHPSVKMAIGMGDIAINKDLFDGNIWSV